MSNRSITASHHCKKPGQALHYPAQINMHWLTKSLFTRVCIYSKYASFLQGASDVNKLMHNLADRQSIYNNDFSQVKGQHHAKRAFEIAASGGHNLLLIGSPGSGKIMLAERLSSIMPPLSIDKALESVSIYSVVNKPLELTQLKIRPFHSPHHSSSAIALVGGGSSPPPSQVKYHCSTKMYYF